MRVSIASLKNRVVVVFVASIGTAPASEYAMAKQKLKQDAVSDGLLASSSCIGSSKGNYTSHRSHIHTRSNGLSCKGKQAPKQTKIFPFAARETGHSLLSSNRVALLVLLAKHNNCRLISATSTLIWMVIQKLLQARQKMGKQYAEMNTHKDPDTMQVQLKSPSSFQQSQQSKE